MPGPASKWYDDTAYKEVDDGGMIVVMMTMMTMVVPS